MPKSTKQVLNDLKGLRDWIRRSNPISASIMTDAIDKIEELRADNAKLRADNMKLRGGGWPAKLPIYHFV